MNQWLKKTNISKNQNSPNSNENIEHLSLQEGVPRVKFECTWKGTLDALFKANPAVVHKFEVLCHQMKTHLLELEQCGATPVLPDGKVGGNAGAKLIIDGKEHLVVSKSGKCANTKMDPYKDFAIIESFNEDTWSCFYHSQFKDTLPTSDTPLHFTALISTKKFKWKVNPAYLLHGHAFETDEDAKKLNVPVSTEETLFSTKEDSLALLKLMEENSFPVHNVFIRRGHGFVLVDVDPEKAYDTFVRLMKPHLLSEN